MNLPRLPLSDAPDGEGADMQIEFRDRGLGVTSAVVFMDGLMVDEVRGHTFREAYDNVRSQYPQATWDGADSEPEDEDA